MSKEAESHSDRSDTPSAPSRPTPPKDSSQRQVREDIPLVESAEDYVTDIKYMLEHCREQGAPISEPLQKEISELQSVPTGERLNKDELFKLMQVHGQLSRVVAPATPRSLASTRFSLRERRSRSTYLFVLSLVLTAIVGLVGYIVTLQLLDSGNVDVPTSDNMLGAPDPNEASLGSRLPASPVTTSGSQQSVPTSTAKPFCIHWHYVFAAIIGAAFNGLLTAYSYLRNRTFDPNYIGIYLIRFVIGVLAGVILANVGSKLFQQDQTISKLGPGVIALLGAYSAEAVRQILDRLVEVLVSIVKGRETFDQQRLTVAEDVLSIAADPNTPKEMKEKLDGLLKKLQQ